MRSWDEFRADLRAERDAGLATHGHSRVCRCGACPAAPERVTAGAGAPAAIARTPPAWLRRVQARIPPRADPPPSSPYEFTDWDRRVARELEDERAASMSAGGER